MLQGETPGGMLPLEKEKWGLSVQELAQDLERMEGGAR
jgi:hypothetical protein